MPLFKQLIVFFNLIRLFPHLILLCLYKNRCKDDIRRGIAHNGYNCNLLWSFCYLLVFDKCYRNIFYWRIGKIRYFVSCLLPPHNCFDIATYMTLGKGFLGIHPVATFVNAESIGDFFSVKNSVTIGNSSSGRPTIGNNVSINANCVVVGGISIGDNVTIGAGTVLMKDVPSDCVVVGNPAYILYQNGVRVNRKL